MAERFFPLSASVAARVDLGMASKLVHAAISAYAAMGRATPGQGRLARELGMSLKTVSRAVRELQESKLLIVSPGPKGKTCTYQLTVANLTTVNLTTVANLTTVPGSNRPVHHGQSDVQIDAENNKTLDVVDRLEWLQLALGSFNPELGKPDATIARRILDATNGASLEDIEAALHRLNEKRLWDRMNSWGLMAVALPEELKRAAQ